MSNQINADVDQYRLKNGRRSLQTCMSSGKSFVVKQDLSEKVVLVSVGSLEVSEVSPEEFERTFICYFRDETPLYLGSADEQKAVLEAMNAEIEAVRFCVYGAASAPAVIS